MSEPECFEFPSPIGAWEVAHAGHPEPVTIPRYVKARDVYNKGGVWPSELNEIAKAFSTLGLTGFGEVRIGDRVFRAREVAVAITMSLPRIMPPEEVERLAAPLFERLGEYALTGVGLATVVKGVKDGKRYTIKYGIACKDAAWLTALPAALGALELASGEVARAGVYPRGRGHRCRWDPEEGEGASRDRGHGDEVRNPLVASTPKDKARRHVRPALATRPL